MSRTSNDQYDTAGALVNGYDYTMQVWVVDYIIQNCEHPERMQAQCQRICTGRKLAGTDIRQAHKGGLISLNTLARITR